MLLDTEIKFKQHYIHSTFECSFVSSQSLTYFAWSHTLHLIILHPCILYVTSTSK